MADFNVDLYLKELEGAQSITECEKVPLPKTGNKNYIFISYSHRDYKKVYADLALMYKNHVRFWYDEGLVAGKNWAEEAKKHIRDPKCAGVVFYLSENLFLSQSIIKEIKITLGLNEDNEQTEEPVTYFCVNLEDECPSEIIISAFQSVDKEDRQKMGYNSRWMKTLNNAFDDDDTYLTPNIANYEANLVKQINDVFGVVDAVADNAAIFDDGVYEGDYKDGKRHGFGKCTYKNGNVYQGEWADNKRNGKGVLTFASGACYEGEFKDDSYSGFGKYSYSKTSNVDYYEGEWLNGKRHGKGDIYYRSGASYTGDWANDTRHGNGRYNYIPSSSYDYYEGTWENDNINGTGMFVKRNGDIYQGEVKDNYYHGNGKITYNEKSPVLYMEGEFAKGKAEGQIKLVYRSGRMFEGIYKNDERFSGKGVVEYVDDAYYDGEWDNGNRNGKGRYVYSKTSNLDYYEGEFKDGKRHGKGDIYYRSGASYTGEWVNDIRQGNGRYNYLPSSSYDYYEGTWENDSINGTGMFVKRNGDTYQGEVKDDYYHGKGIITYNKNHPLISMEGDFVKGKANGNIKITYRSGNVFEGIYQNDERISGKGVIEYVDGAYYDGEISDRNLNGFGRYVFAPTATQKYYEGEYKDGKRHGKGKMVYAERSNIDYSEGNWENGKLNGIATMVFKSGARYEGEWKDDLYHGKAVYTYPKNSDVDYFEGIYQNDRRNGPGKLVYKNGAYYQGDFKDERFDGKGKYVYDKNSNIDYYEGDYANDRKTGKGIMVFKSGAKYEGDWLNNMYHGFGRFTYNEANERAYYEGDWKDDFATGNAVIVYKNGNKYEGQTFKSVSHGKGVFTYADGAKWEGEFNSGKFFNGYGEVRMQSGARYVGDMTEAKYNGHGKYYYAASSTLDYYEGGFKDDSRHGSGITVYKNGLTEQGEFSNGKEEGMFKITFPKGYINYVDVLFSEGKRDNVATIYYSDGSKYKGSYTGMFIPHGAGRTEYPENSGIAFYQGEYRDGAAVNGFVQHKNGDSYEGTLKNAKYHGKGKYIYAASQRLLCYEGDWYESQKVGFGKETYKNGEYYEGEWVDSSYNGRGVYVFTEAKYEGIWKDGYFYYKGTLSDNNGNFFSGTFALDGAATGTITLTDGSFCEVVCGEIIDKRMERLVPSLLKVSLMPRKKQ